MSASARVAVLIVDDDPDVRETMVDLVESCGRQAFSAIDGLDALRKLESAELPRPCMILVDWMMAPMNGAEFLTHLETRPDSSQLPVVVMTASNRDVAGEPLPLAVVSVLPKPFDVEDFLATLEQIESQCGPREE